MLLQFSVENHLSLRDRAQLSMVASSLKDVEVGLIRTPTLPNSLVLPSAIIYGANASGKSNLVSAMRWMRTAVLRSHSDGEPDGGVPRAPFALDPACAAKPTRTE